MAVPGSALDRPIIFARSQSSAQFLSDGYYFLICKVKSPMQIRNVCSRKRVRPSDHLCKGTGRERERERDIELVAVLVGSIK